MMRAKATTLQKETNKLVWLINRGDAQGLKVLLQTERMLGLDDLAKALRFAAEKGEEECLQILLDAHAMPNIHDISGFTPLILAARRGHVNVLRQLLASKECRVNKATFRVHATALHWAATNGHARCVDLLLEAGANPEAQTMNGSTPLMMAARTGYGDIVADLIQTGCNVNTRNYSWSTALHQAAEEGNVMCVRMLIKAGANIDSQTKQGDTPLIRAASRGHDEVMDILMSANCDVEKRGRMLSPLHWAADGGHTECLNLLLGTGMNPNIITLDSYYGGDFVVDAGVTPLMLASKNGHADAARLLVTWGAFVDQVDDNGTTGLLLAVKHNHGECTSRLIEAGADPDGVWMKPIIGTYPTERGLSPLFMALKENSRCALKALLRANCNLYMLGLLNQEQYVGPLDYTLALRHIDASRMLLLAGADLGICNPAIAQDAVLWLLDKDEDLAARLVEQLYTPPPLMQISRKNIRGWLGRRVLQLLPLLPLPTVLLRYVALQDLDDF